MEIPHTMTTLTCVMEHLRLKKMDSEFRWTQDGFTIGRGKTYHPGDLAIIKIYRFEEITNPADMCVLYLIEANDGLIGYSLNAYGTYSNHENEEGYDNFIRLIPERDRIGQLLFEI